jgi:DNA repair protein RadA/Sms
MQIKTQIKGLKNGTNILDINVPKHMRVRVKTGTQIVDELFDQGLVPSMCGLFTGTPGAGKTTLSLTMADSVTGLGHTCLYNSGEESAYQVKMTVERLKLKNGFVWGQDEMVDDIIKHARQLIETQVLNKTDKKGAPAQFFVVIDSLPTINDGKYGPGNINGTTAVRATEMLIDFCKGGHKGVFPILLMIGHVTKGGMFAGKQQVKHALDFHTHLYIDDSPKSDTYGCRLIEAQKNRYGSAGKKIIVAMEEGGLVKVGEYTYA